MGYTEEDIRLVARAVAPEYPRADEDDNYRDDAARVLAALAAAGRLLPADADTEWAWQHDDGSVICHHEVSSEANVRAIAASQGGTALYRRVGPWAPVKPAALPTGTTLPDQLGAILTPQEKADYARAAGLAVDRRKHDSGCEVDWALCSCAEPVGLSQKGDER